MALSELTRHRSRGTWSAMPLCKRIFAMEMVVFGLFALVPIYIRVKYTTKDAADLRLNDGWYWN